METPNAVFGALDSLAGATATAIHATKHASCTHAGCVADTLVIQGVSFRHWALFWEDGCNACVTDLTVAVVAGVCLLFAVLFGTIAPRT